jgi:hypothetical protein
VTLSVVEVWRSLHREFQNLLDLREHTVSSLLLHDHLLLFFLFFVRATLSVIAQRHDHRVCNITLVKDIFKLISLCKHIETRFVEVEDHLVIKGLILLIVELQEVLETPGHNYVWILAHYLVYFLNKALLLLIDLINVFWLELYVLHKDIEARLLQDIDGEVHLV